MLASLRSNWLSIRASYWFYHALFALAALALATLLIHVDRIGASEWLSRSHWIVPARPEGASNMLTVLSSAMIGVAATVFSITIAAVAYASGNYGPRLLTNFMEDKGNQLSLAMFIGTFVYAITVLRAVRTGDATPVDNGFVPQLALLVAYVLMIASVGVLVYFLHHIPASIRINTVLENIGMRLLREIERRFPEMDETDPPVRTVARGGWVRSDRTGYVRLIELGVLADAAHRHGVTVGLAVRPGDFVYPGTPIARTDADPVPDKVAQAIRETFAIGSTRTPEMDLEFSIDELVEIALRALSPGINDPFTAITATHWLGAATAELGRRDLAAESWNTHGPDCPVAPPQSDFAHFLERGFTAARGALASNRLSALVALETLAKAAGQVRGSHRRALIEREVQLLAQQAEEHLTGPDIADVRQRHEAIRAGWS
ncbi:DUF2254 domain-containing protein [Novosphingobium album (ex Hu et al. 2023)]|uniref:DUF2254 domain-containing protein n=1 Tax=Novosphingobium album (ex Hu et al. 2023) TaxID=2930093 RepID=A0ABT0B6C0_9SPHN|nr:DUF2254 domain-containing protein [Novosphingobium album (ex Hu et al. 2023)]MCJ2180589.1 DUF2254 domain-containing protein [Novosphingobium album (ex Hu et al. 2023)]